MHEYACTHACICTFIHTYVNEYIHTRINTYIGIHTCIHICILPINTYLTYIHKPEMTMRPDRYMHMTYTHTYIGITHVRRINTEPRCIQIHTDIHVHTHTHIHTCISPIYAEQRQDYRAPEDPPHSHGCTQGGYLYVCMYVFMYVCMHACVCVYIYIYIYI
jgi:hypothetical protein